MDDIRGSTSSCRRAMEVVRPSLDEDLHILPIALDTQTHEIVGNVNQVWLFVTADTPVHVMPLAGTGDVDDVGLVDTALTTTRARMDLNQGSHVYFLV